MGALTTVMAYFRGGTLISSSIDFITKALQNKYVLIGIAAVCLLWIYDTKVQAEYTAKHAQQEIAALTTSLEGYRKAFKELADHTRQVYKDRDALDDLLEQRLPTFDEVIHEGDLAELETELEEDPEEAVRKVEKVTLDIFDSIETRLNGGANGA